MATHTIKMRDWRHDEPRTIVWNDETGEVSGDHVWVQGIRDMIERAERAGGVLTHYGFWRLADPRRDPACFVAVDGAHRLAGRVDDCWRRVPLGAALCATPAHGTSASLTDRPHGSRPKGWNRNW